MAKLQAKTEEQRLHIANILGFAVPIDENGNGISTLCYVEFDTLAEIVDYLRKDMMIIDLSTDDKAIEGAKELTFEMVGTFWERLVAEQQKISDYDRLLDENRKLNNDNFRLLEENKQLKEKTKNLPRIATLNKRIHELKEQLKDGNKQSI